MINKIIICKGSGFCPARFWDWAVCTIEEYTEELKCQGWVKSQCKKYLTNKQISYLNSI